MLTLIVVGLLCHQNSLLAIAEWATDLAANLKGALGFADQVTPHQTTLHRLLRRLDAAALEDVLSRYWVAVSDATSETIAGDRPRGSQGVALDGKVLRGMLHCQGTPDRQGHLLSAFWHDLGVVLGQVAIASKEAELTVAPSLIARLDWHGRVLPGDALLCQRNLCAQVVAAGGDYVLVVKGNQLTVEQEIATVFQAIAQRQQPTQPLAQPWFAPPVLEYQEVTTCETGHGRQQDTRRIRLSTELAGYTDWPHLAQVFELQRTWIEHGTTHQDTWYGLTSLPRAVADAARILELKRAHWQIENRLHWVKDVTFGEDASLIHVGAGPQVLAACRNLALSLLRSQGVRQIAATRRRLQRHPRQALAFVGVQSPLNA